MSRFEKEVKELTKQIEKLSSGLWKNPDLVNIQKIKALTEELNRKIRYLKYEKSKTGGVNESNF